MLKINGFDLSNHMLIKEVQVRDHVETVVKNSNIWSLKKLAGSILITGALLDIARIEDLKDILKDGIMQIDDKYYRVSLSLGVSKNLDPKNFTIVFNFFREPGVGVYPMAPNNVSVVVNGKLATVRFKKGLGAAKTRVDFEGRVFETASEYVVLESAYANVLYTAKLSSISNTGVVGEECSIVKFTTEESKIVPSLPQDVKVVEVVGKYITLEFTKGLNAHATQAIIDGEIYETYDSKITVVGKEYSTVYSITLRSRSVDGNYSNETQAVSAVTGANVIPEVPTINDVRVEENVVIVEFTKGENAKVTEIRIGDNIDYVEGNIIRKELAKFNTVYKLKARSISATDGFSEYTSEVEFTTGSKITIPTAPYNVKVSEIVGKVATVSFVKGDDAELTEVLVGGNITSTTGEKVEITVPEFNSQYIVKARSKSVSSHVSDWSEEVSFTSGIEGVKPAMPSNISTNVAGRMLTVSFVKGENAELTEVIVDDEVYSTNETSISIPLKSFSKYYSVKLRSIGLGKVVGDFTDDISIKSDSKILYKNIRLEADSIYCPVANENITNSYIHNLKVSLNDKELIKEKANRYSINGSMVDGKLN